MNDSDYRLFVIGLAVATLGLLVSVIVLAFVIPFVIATYIVIVTIFFLAMDIQHQGDKDIDDYIVLILIWLFSPFFFWYSL